MDFFSGFLPVMVHKGLAHLQFSLSGFAVVYNTSYRQMDILLLAVLLWLSTAGFVLVEGEGLLFFSFGIWIQKISFNIDEPNKWLLPKL
jgi:hypothetical protein